MAITLTTGTNTYATLAEADAYFENFGNVDWVALDEESRKQALVLATQSLDLLYGEKYKSGIATSSQSLLFPRLQFYDNDGRTVNGIPAALKNATAEVALMQTNGVDIFPIANSSVNVRSESLSVGGISISTENYRSNESETFIGFRKVDILLRTLLKPKVAVWSIKA